MTESEAKEILQASLECEEKENAVIFDYQCDKDCEACELNYAQGTVGEHKEAMQMAIRALEKQIAKKPKKSGVTDKRGIFHPINGIDGVPYDLCPLCEANLCTTGILGRKKMNYCKECGQKLDWSDE